MHRIRLAAAIVIGIGIAEANAQDARTHIGVLTCTVDTQTLRMTCGFKSSKTGVEERYLGKVLKGEMSSPANSGKRVLVWAVIGANSPHVGPGSLSQRYSIAAAAPVLIGEARAIALQSETTDGAGKVTQLELTQAKTSANVDRSTKTAGSKLPRRVFAPYQGR